MRQLMCRAATLLLSLIVACNGDSPSAPLGDKLVLTQQQVSLLASRVAQLASVHPDLAWLGDSIDVVLRVGAQADKVEITTDLGAGPFWAVGLQRAIVPTGANAFNTFGFLAFNNPNAPTDFVVVSGYKLGSGSTAPTSVSTMFGIGGELFGHLMHVEGTSVLAWRATAGAGFMSSSNDAGACPGFTATAGITCTQNPLGISFAISSSTPDGGSATGSKNAALTLTSVPGIRLLMTF